MELYDLKPPSGSNKDRKRVGRGPGCHGKTAGRGNKGQKSRSGGAIRRGFEGGQMPLYRRVPKRGFTNIFAKRYAEVDIHRLDGLKDIKEFTPEVMVERGIVKKRLDGIKVLGKGDITRPIKLKINKISKGAREKIEKAGGTVEVIE